MPQNVTELAKYLPIYPKNLAVIIVKVRGRDNTFKDVNVRKQKAQSTLFRIQHSPHYSEVTINEEAVNSLPENNIPVDLLTLETEDEIPSQDSVMPDVTRLAHLTSAASRKKCLRLLGCQLACTTVYY